MARMTRAEALEFLAAGTRTGKLATVGGEPHDAPDLVEWATRIAQRYVPAEKAARYGERNGVPGEMLCRLRMRRITAERDIAL